jgi:dihydroorotate dehydrogenase electron transfer subunit
MISSQPTPSRHRLDGRVLSNEPICREHYALRLRIEGVMPPTRAGQFVQLGCRPPNGCVDLEKLRGSELEWGPAATAPPRLQQPELCAPLALLRRPFSLAGRGEDEGGTWVEVIHRVVGVGTQWLAQLAPGARVDMIGPLGNAFTLPGEKSIGLLVGGGVGLPPMFYLAQALREAGWEATGFVGAMSRDLLAVHFVDGAPAARDATPGMCVEEFARYGYPAVMTTDDGSLGLKGRITAGLERVLQKQTPQERWRTVVYTCGPERMMHAAAELAARYDVACQVCLEQAMACGMGTCQSCVVKIDPRGSSDGAQGRTGEGRPWRFRLACTQGPVFNARDVVWNAVP